MVRTLLVALLGLAVAAPLAAGERLPAEVRKYIEQREGCEHFRGEVPDPPDEQRMREVNREIKRLCKGTDKQLARLKKKYARAAPVIKRLNEFEPQIEATQTR